MPNLLWFEWERDLDGYRIVSLKAKDVGDVEKGDDSEETIEYFVPIGRRTIRYRPLEEHPALFMEFAQLSQSSTGLPTSQDVKEFVDKYGLLKSSQKPLRVGDVIWDSMRMKDGVYWWRKGEQTGDLTQFIADWNKVRLAPIDIRFDKAWDATFPSLFIKPKDLLAAMWLQIAQAVSKQTDLRKCLHCPTWFTYGPGTGRRKTAFYCSDRCRRAAHRAKEHQK